MNYKNYIDHIFLIEGKKQLEKKYIDTGKIDAKILNSMLSTMWTHGKAKPEFENKYADWIIHEVYRLYTNKMIKSMDIYASNNNAIFLSLVKAAALHFDLSARRVVKGMLPLDKSKKEIDWMFKVKEMLQDHAEKKTATGLSGDYKKKYDREGFEIFACVDHQSVVSIGASANWCIRREENYWNDYNREGYNFFVVIDHHRAKTDPYRKVCIQYSDHEITIWDYDDNNMNLDTYIKNISDITLDEPLDNLENAINSLGAFDSEYEEDSNLAEIIEEYDELDMNLTKWYEENNERKDEFEKEASEEVEGEIKKIKDQIESATNTEELEELKTKLEKYEDWVEAEEYEEAYDDINGQYKYDTLRGESEPGWYPVLTEMIKEWWRDHGNDLDTINQAIWDRTFEDSWTAWNNLPNPNVR
jgi:hypothetical protein